jgi:hypothetical protein
MNDSSASPPLQQSAVGLAVELGSGSLDKTRLLLRSMAKLLQPQNEEEEEGVMKKIDYRAVRFAHPLLSSSAADFLQRTQLDLEAGSLHSSLSMLASVEGECVTTSLDSPDSPSALNKSGKRRVSVSGLHATYDEGLAFLKSQAGGGNGVKDSDISPFSSPETSPVRLPAVDEESISTSPSAAEAEKRKTSILWLGSSIGNFTRVEAVEFLKGIELGEGDTMLIGVDGCADGPKIVEAYNDPEVRPLRLA